MIGLNKLWALILGALFAVSSLLNIGGSTMPEIVLPPEHPINAMDAIIDTYVATDALGRRLSTNEETGDKVGVNTDYGRPEFTLMNPELTYTLPPYQTACGIVDIMMHTFERYFSPGGLNDMTDEIAEAVIRNTKKYGSIAMENPEDYDARSELFWSGSISHIDLTGLGRTGDWASHRLEHELSGMFDVAHGAGLSAIWGAWARYTYKEAPERFIRMGEEAWELDLVNLEEKEAVEIMIDTVLKYFKELGMPINTTELLGRQLSEEEILKLADNSSKKNSRTLGNFKVLNREDMIDIFRMSV
jgi:alcohol dehydrogenase YqhD (iron-dependent ADH family)